MTELTELLLFPLDDADELGDAASGEVHVVACRLIGVAVAVALLDEFAVVVTKLDDVVSLKRFGEFTSDSTSTGSSSLLQASHGLMALCAAALSAAVKRRCDRRSGGDQLPDRVS